MSRSYRKYLSVEHHEFDPPHWSGFRKKEQVCILKEHQSQEYGEVVFPRYNGSHKSSWYCSTRRYYPKKRIRDDYFKDIRDILNAYQDKEYYWIHKGHNDCQEYFLDAFNRIKNGECPADGRWYSFEWLNSRKVKEAIKNWNGEPLDVLYYLTDSGLIEKAVQEMCNWFSRK